jgi:membrane protein DedA with SNARE-associated domain
MTAFSLTKVATDLIASLGYGGLVVGLVVDSMGIPIPSEVLIPLAAALARTGRLNLAAVVALGTGAQMVGAVLSYWIGRSGGVALVKRYGKYVLFSEHELAITERWFARYGKRLSVIGRCLPVVRGYVGYPAGVAKMPFPIYVGVSLIGAFLWTVFLATLGYQLGSHLELIDQIFRRFAMVIIGLLIVGVIWYVKRHRK